MTDEVRGTGVRRFPPIVSPKGDRTMSDASTRPTSDATKAAVLNDTNGLHEQLDHARANLTRLSAEYDELLHDPDVIQEDRDSVRQLVEEAAAAVTSLEQAVARVDSGTYGTCATCGQAIAPERLEALPDAKTCVTCS